MEVVSYPKKIYSSESPISIPSDDLLKKIIKNCEKYFSNNLKIINIYSDIEWSETDQGIQYHSQQQEAVYLTVVSDHTSCVHDHHFIQSLSTYSTLLLIKFPDITTYLSYNFQFQQIFRYSEVIASHTCPFIYVFLSNQYWYADGNLGKFTQIFLDTTIMIKNLGSERNYYENSQYLMKYYYILTRGGRRHIKQELEKEIEFLKSIHTDVFPIPKIVATNQTDHTCWLLREKLSGEPLENLIKLNAHQTYNPGALILALLRQAAFLEIRGYYHTDIVPRNTLVLNSESAILIDFGAFEKQHPTFDKLIEIYLKYVMLAYEILHNVIIKNRKFSPIHMSNKDLHPLYQRWIQWIVSVPMTSWSFLMLETLFKNAQNNSILNSKVVDPDLQDWLKKIHSLQENKKLRLRRFQFFLKDKSEEYFYDIPWVSKIIRRLKHAGIICYDTLTLFGKQLVTGQVPTQRGTNNQF